MTKWKERVSKTKNDISTWVLNNNFMTEREITKMYSLLKGHMFMKWKNYNDEVIQLTILTGLKNSKNYDPTKSSKLVWFQSILKNIYLQEIDPKYNKHIRNHYSLDWTAEDSDEENMDILKEASLLTVGEEDNDIINIADGILKLLETDKFPISKFRAEGLNYQTIANIVGIKRHKVAILIKEERVQIKRLLSGLPGLELLDLRTPINDKAVQKLKKMPNPNKEPKEKKTYKFNPMSIKKGGIKTCITCGGDFILTAPNKKTCSEECMIMSRKKLTLLRVKPKSQLGDKRKCKVCDKDFEYVKGMGSNTKTCSFECKEVNRKTVANEASKMNNWNRRQRLKLDI